MAYDDRGEDVARAGDARRYLVVGEDEDGVGRDGGGFRGIEAYHTHLSVDGYAGDDYGFRTDGVQLTHEFHCLCHRDALRVVCRAGDVARLRVVGKTEMRHREHTAHGRHRGGGDAVVE